jgi:hypothetical protein
MPSFLVALCAIFITVSPSVAEVDIAKAIETWGGADLILVGELTEARAGPVGLSNPPLHTHRLSLKFSKVLRGRIEAKPVIIFNHSARQQNAPAFPVGRRCIIAAEKSQRGLTAKRVVEATEAALAEVEQISAIPFGWGLQKRKLASPWGQIEGAKWVGVEGDDLLRCEITRRPAFLAGENITLKVAPKNPPKRIKWTNPDGDGIYIVTATNQSDRAITIPALLGSGGKATFGESVAIRVQGKAYPAPGANGTGVGLAAVTLQPGESVSGEINALALEGPEWPRGGTRITFQFCLGELAASHSFYYMSRHHDKIREAALKALKG